MDGISNTTGVPTLLDISMGLDNDGIRDDVDLDDDSDGTMEVRLPWPQRYNNESTNPWITMTWWRIRNC